MKSPIIIIVFVFFTVVALATAVILFSSDDTSTQENTLSDTQQNTNNSNQNEQTTDIQRDSNTQEESPAVETTGGIYTDYDSNKLTDEVNVLFFHASWCPTCKELNTSLENERDDIPSNVTILKTDYDKESDLKKKYGVTYQHTLVQVDRNGNEIKKWSGGFDLGSILNQIQN